MMTRPLPGQHAAAAAARHGGASRLWLLVLLALVSLSVYLSRHQYRAVRLRESGGGVSLSRGGGTGPSSSSSSFSSSSSSSSSTSSYFSSVAAGLAGAARSIFPSSSTDASSSARGSSSSSSSSDTSTIHIAYTSCGLPNPAEPDMYGLISAKSLLMARANGEGRKRKYMFHIISTSGEEELLNTTAINYDVARAVAADPEHLSMRVYTLEDTDAAVREAGADPDAVPHTIFKTCAASRLKLPFLLARQKVERVLYLDWDSVVTCDLTALYEGFEEFNEEQFIGFATNDPTGVSEKDIYRDSDIPRHPVYGGISSGTMMMDIGKMVRAKGKGKGKLKLSNAGSNASTAPKAAPTMPSFAGGLIDGYWSDIIGIISAKIPDVKASDFWRLTSAFPLGDQDILNALLAHRPEIMWLVPPAFNWCLGDLVPFDDIKRAGFVRPVPCVHHFCGARLWQSETMSVPNSPDVSYLKGLYEFYRAAPLHNVPEDPPGVRGWDLAGG